jgi:SAM-dependent methyltransferase
MLLSASFDDMSQMPPDSQTGLDAATTDFYDRYALELVERPEARRSAMSARFADVFRPGERVLDIGAGSGRDMVILFEQGCDPYGVEPNASMRALAIDTHPQLAGRIVIGALPELGSPFNGEFDGIVCSAVLMHVLRSDVEAALTAMSRLLVTGGRLLVSLPVLDAGRLLGDRDDDRRLFTNHAPESIAEMLVRVRLREVDRWDSDAVLAQSGARWHTLLFIRG